jgi:phage replication O-like protein O
MENPWKSLSRIHPELDNGFRQIESSVLKALMRAKMTATELRICLAVIDKTWGHQMTWDYISSGYLARMTGINRRNIQRSTDDLVDKRILIIESRGPRKKLKVMFNKYHDTWTNLTVEAPPDRTLNLTVETPPDETNLTVERPPDEKNSLEVEGPPADGRETSRPDGTGTATINKKQTLLNKSPSGKRKKTRLDFSFDIQVTAASLKSSLLQIKPDRKPISENQLVGWMDDLRKLLEIDKIEMDRILELVKWLPNTQDTWIRRNMGSAQFVRKWFDRLESEMRSPPGGQSHRSKRQREDQAGINWLQKGAEHG